MREGLVGGDEVERFFSGIAARPEQGAAGAGDVERNDAVFLRGFGRRLLAARTRLGMPRWQLAARSGAYPQCRGGDWECVTAGVAGAGGESGGGSA